MTCRAWEELLQDHLDGADGDRLEQHFQSCSHCAAEKVSVRRLLEGVTLLGPITPSVDLAKRIVDCLRSESRHQRRKQLRRRLSTAGLLAVAAALLLVVGIRLFHPDSRIDPTSPISPTNPTNPTIAAIPRTATPRTPAPGFRDSVAEASNAVASLTSRAASETLDQTTSLLPLLPSGALEPFTAEPAPIEPLREASANVSAGLAPVADSARRAFGLFLRDLPMGRTDSPATTGKPG